MHCLKPTTALIAILILAVSACGRGPGSPSSAFSPTATDSGAGLATMEAGLAEGGSRYGEYARWPEEIPADIPPLEGEIEVVMVAPGSHIRIVYSSVSEQTVSQYLAHLDTLGFQLEYIVYSSPAIPDADTAKRIARGEWDAVDITKGPYLMRLEPGGGQATYDIYTAGFWTPDPSTLITATPIVWPSDIPDRVPQPATCEIRSLAQLGTPGYEGGYQISFECSDPLVQKRYVEVLRGGGLVETDRLVSDTGQIVEITLKDKEIAVKALGVVGFSFTIQVWPVAP